MFFFEMSLPKVRFLIFQKLKNILELCFLDKLQYGEGRSGFISRHALGVANSVTSRHIEFDRQAAALSIVLLIFFTDEKWELRCSE